MDYRSKYIYNSGNLMLILLAPLSLFYLSNRLSATIHYRQSSKRRPLDLLLGQDGMLKSLDPFLETSSRQKVGAVTFLLL